MMQTKYDELARLAKQADEWSENIGEKEWYSDEEIHRLCYLISLPDAGLMAAANPATIQAMHADMVAMVSELTRCRTMLLILQEELEQDDIERWNSLQLRIEQIDAALARVKETT